MQKIQNFPNRAEYHWHHWSERFPVIFLFFIDFFYLVNVVNVAGRLPGQLPLNLFSEHHCRSVTWWRVPDLSSDNYNLPRKVSRIWYYHSHIKVLMIKVLEGSGIKFQLSRSVKGRAFYCSDSYRKVYSMMTCLSISHSSSRCLLVVWSTMEAKTSTWFGPLECCLWDIWHSRVRSVSSKLFM